MADHLVYIGLGSNLGDRRKMLDEAIERMPPKIQPLVLSHIYETPPWGYTDQPPFLNQVLKAQTCLFPQLVLKELKLIEKSIGRKPNFRYGPRLIDLDILFYNDDVIHTEDLTIPHPELANRGFVLIPMLEIAPDFRHPVLNKTIQQLAENVNRNNIQIMEKKEI